MRKRLTSIACVVTSVFAVSTASADSKTKQVRITVVDIAGGQIYVEPGAEVGLRVGQQVRIGKRNYRISSVNNSSATMELKRGIPTIGTKGKATVPRVRRKRSGPISPSSLDSFKQQWKSATLPASEQSPTNIPIATSHLQSPTEVVVIARGNAIQPLTGGNDTVSHLSVRAIVRSQPFGDSPFGIDADVEVGKWLGRSGDQGSGSRPLAQLQELRLRYGDRDAPFLGLGRLRNAAHRVGLLDGIRVEGDITSKIALFAFGGVVPNALDGKPSTDLARFGSGVSYSDDQHAMRPEAELTFYGSNFDGSLDERRATMDVFLRPGPFSLAASSEFALFSSDNPWGASALELTMASLDARYRKGRFTTSVSLSAQQPERSRWLASLLPPSWLCTASPGAGQPSEACNGNRDYRIFALYTASLSGRRFLVQGGTTAVLGSGTGLDQIAAFADLRLSMPFQSNLGISLLSSRADFISSSAVRLELARPIRWHNADVALYYRPEVHSYQAALSSIVEHRVGVDTSVPVRQDLSVRLSTETVQSSEIRYVAGFATLLWRVL